MAGIAWARRLRQTADRVPNLNLLEVLPLVSVVLLLLRAPHVWYLQLPLTLLCVVGLAFRSTIRTSTFWYLAATMVGATVYLNWDAADNHKYMICYWCLALCCVFSLPEPQQRPALALASRWLIGLCMAWAVLWKAINIQYLDGTFFEFTLLSDERFAEFAASLTGVTRDTLATNRQLIELLTAGHLRGFSVEAVTLAQDGWIVWLAAALTWWTILIELALAVLFLWPHGPRVAAARNAVLLVFAVTTYAVAPVVGFGWMLMLLGMAQADHRNKWLKLAYLGVFLLILVYTLPLTALTNILLS